ncbi:MAG: thiol:disulfide interchange protein DsbC [Francisellaceae bacterium]|nr:thiol:disulfide interchange protein DsbC [Francisellaceae bacterium]
MKRIIGLIALLLVNGLAYSANSPSKIIKEKDLKAAIKNEAVLHSPQISPVEVEAKLKTQFPEFKIDKITDSPLKDFYQVYMGAQIFYVSKDSHYLMHGELMDLRKDKADQNLTEMARGESRLKLLQEIKESDLLIYRGEKKKATITVAFDPTCYYCQKLHNEIKALNEGGIEVRYMAFPRSAPNTPAYDKIVSIWCADNPKEAMEKVIKNEEIPTKACINTVSSQAELGQKLGVRGTPSIFFEDGFMSGGFMDAGDLIKQALSHTFPHHHTHHKE